MTDTAPPPARVSVVIPLYNTERYIQEALLSVSGQTRKVWETIVVDDGSTDSGPELVRAFPWVRLIRKNHSGIYPTMNCGLAAASGDLIAFLDADDRWVASKTERQCGLLEGDPTLDMVFGHARRFLMVAPRVTREERHMDVMPGNSAPGGMFRRALFARVGNFDESPGISGFVDWYARARMAGARECLLPEVMFERRIHDRNEGVVNRDAKPGKLLQTLKAKLDRERKYRPGP